MGDTTARAVLDALWPILGGNHTDAQTWQQISDAVSGALARRIEAEAVPVACKRPHCETCGKDAPEVLCPTCAKWWHDNPPELEARATAAEAKVAVLRDELRMAVAIISAELPHAPMLANFRAALQETTDVG
jgi:hypothetical protein